MGPFVRRISLQCTKSAINDGIHDVLVGPHRKKVESIHMKSQGVPRELLARLAGRLQQQGLTGLEMLDVSYSSVVPRDGNDDPIPSSLNAAALQYCSNLIHLVLEDDKWDTHSPKRFDFLPMAQALRLRGVNGKARPLHTLHLR